MKILANRDGLLAAFSMVSAVVPARSPKIVLQSIKVVATDDGSYLIATDLEVSVRYQVLGIKVDRPGSALLNPAKLGSILRTTRDEELAIETEDGTLSIRGLHATFDLPSEDPDLFPEAPDFTATDYHVLAAADLKRLIRRTIYATDVDSTRYALGGVLFERTFDSLSLIGTDGRRLAKATCEASVQGSPAIDGTSPVIPVKALKLIDRNLPDDDEPVHLAIDKQSAMVRTDRAVIYTRLVEGRFPRYQDVFPANVAVRIPIAVGALLSAVEQASIVTSEESRGIDFNWTVGMLRLNSSAADVGKSRVETPIDYDGPEIVVSFDPRYVADMLKTLDPSSEITVGLIDHKNACEFVADDGAMRGVVMPLTRDR